MNKIMGNISHCNEKKRLISECKTGLRMHSEADFSK